MKASLQSEFLKIKRSGHLLLLALIPFVTIFIAYIMVGPNILIPFSVYWWEAIVLIILLSLLFISDFLSDNTAGNFQNIIHKHYESEIIFSKILLIFVQVLVASILFVTFLKLVSLLYVGIIEVSAVKVLLTLCLMLVAVSWNLPLLYLLSNWINPYILLIGNTFICLLVAPLIAQTPFWFLFPFTYHYKVAQVLLSVKPSGDVLTTGTTPGLMPLVLAILLSVLLTSVLVYLIGRRFSYARNLQKRSAKTKE